MAVAIGFGTLFDALAVAQAPSFRGLVPYPDFVSSARHASADGRTIVGDAGPPFASPTRTWRTSGDGFEDLTASAGSIFAKGGSADANVLVGDRFIIVNGELSQVATRWTSSGTVELGFLPTGFYSLAFGASGDGSIVVGQSAVAWDGPGLLGRGFRWTAAEGMRELRPVMGDPQSGANAISRDGTVIVGSSGDNRPQTGNRSFRAVRWTSDGVPHELGSTPDGVQSTARGANVDGSVIIGSEYISISGATAVEHAFRWDVAGGIHDLGFAPGHQNSRALGINGDGTIVVGSGSLAGVGSSRRAILWTADLGMVDLNTYLPTLGIDLTGWILSEAKFISDDGRTLVGSGSIQIGPLPSDRLGLAWVATIPAPSASFILGLAALAPRRRR